MFVLRIDRIGAFFKTDETRKYWKGFLVFALLYACIGDFTPWFDKYSRRQVAGKVPYGYKTKFWLYKPSNYSSQGNGFPLLVSLHGGSAIGSNLNMLFEKTHENPPQLIHINKWFDLPFIVLSPQLKRDLKVSHYNEQNWPPELVDEVIEYVKKEYNVDSTRIYLTGISLGAAGAWKYAAAYPHKVAALLPMGGQASTELACKVKDIPIWAFHGENDVFVRPRFTTEIKKEIESCSPAGKFTMHASLCKSMEHEVWDQLFNLTGGYDVYNWLLSFKKGDTSNIAPFVFAGLDRKMKLSPDGFYLTAEYFDSDGSIVKVKWSQVDNGSPAVHLENAESRFLKIVGAKVPGKYLFKVSVTDNKGAITEDEVSVTLLEESEALAVVKMHLTSQMGSRRYAALKNDGVYNIGDLGNKINILAETQGYNVRVRWSINSDQNTRSTAYPFFLRATDMGAIKSGWTISEGEYLVCATAFENVNGDVGDEGTSLCYKIVFTNYIKTEKLVARQPTDSCKVSIAGL